MNDSAQQTALAELQEHLQRLLPRFELAPVTLPRAPEIRLWLFRDLHPDRPLDEATVNTLMETPPYWTLCWASGQVLARHILDRPECVRDRTVLDFGAGSGVVAIAAALAGAARVIACDTDPVSCDAIHVNAAANDVVVETCTGLHEAPVPDLITAADILYDRANIPVLGELARHAGAVLLADSRIPGLDPDGYTLLGADEATTWPDPGEDKAFNQVRLFGSGWLQGPDRATRDREEDKA